MADAIATPEDLPKAEETPQATSPVVSKAPVVSTGQPKPPVVPQKAEAKQPKIPTWDEITKDPEFASTPGEKKEAVRQQYRDLVLKPKIKPELWPAIRDQFDKKTKPETVATTGEYLKQSVKKIPRDLLDFPVDIVHLGTQGAEAVGGMFGVQPTPERKKGLEDIISRYHDVTRKITDTESEKASPGFLTKVAGSGIEFLGVGAEKSVTNILTRSGTVGKAMQAARELLSSGGAASGMEAAEKISDSYDLGPMGRFLLVAGLSTASGGMLEQLAPTVIEKSYYKAKGLTEAFDKAYGEKIKEGLSPTEAKKYADTVTVEIEKFRASSIGKEFRKAIATTPNVEQAEKEATAAERGIPGFHANMAMRTGSESIKEHGTQAAKKSDAVAAAINASQSQAAKALNDFAESLIVSGKKTAQEAVAIVSNSDVAKIVKDIDANNAKISEMSGRLNSGDFFTKEDGESLLKMRDDAAKKVSRLYSEMYHSLYAAADYAGVTIDMSSAYRRILGTESEAGNVATRFPSTYALIKSRIKTMPDAEKNDAEIADLSERARHAEGKQATLLYNRIRSLRTKQLEAEKSDEPISRSLEEAHSFLKSINEDRFSPNVAPNDKRLLNELYDSVSKSIKDQWPGAWDKLQKINDGYKTNYIEVFREGAAGRMIAENKYGLVTPEQRLMTPYFRRGAQGAEEFLKVFGNGAESTKLVRQGLADEFAQVVKDREVTPEMVRNFAAKHKDFMERFPDVKKEYEGVQSVAKGLQDEASRLAELKDRAVSYQLGRLLDSTDPKTELLKNLRSADFMGRMRTMAERNPEVAQSLAYEYGKIAMDLTPQQARQMLIEHQAELKPIFDAFAPGHYDKLLTLSVGRQVLGRGFPDIGYKMDIEPDIIQRTTGTPASSVLNRFYAIATFKAGTLWSGLYLLSRYFSKEQMKNWENLVADAFTNPKFVDELMQTEYGPLLKAAKEKGISVEQLVDSMPGLAAGGKESLKSALSKVKAKAGEAFEDLHHSLAAHGYRVLIMTPVNVEQKAQEQDKRKLPPQQQTGFNRFIQSIGVQP